jgi:hypothetical protein
MDVTIPCPCPRKADGEPRHESDTVTLRDVLNFHQAATVANATMFIDNDDPDSRAAEVLAVLSEYYVLVGVERWTLLDAAGKRVEVSKSAIRKNIIDRPEIAAPVVDAADELYSAAILLPLALKASRSSPPTPTTVSTSPKPAGTPRKARKPSKRSLTSTTPTDATETTSLLLVGDSNLSPSSESAA